MKKVNSPWLIAMIMSSLVLSGCNELNFDMGDEPEEVTEQPTPEPTPEPAPEPTAPQAVSAALVLEQSRIFNVVWEDVPGADYYRVFENPDGVSGFTQVGPDVAPGIETVSFESPLLDRVDSEYMIEACNELGCTQSSTIFAEGDMAEGIGYIKSIFPIYSSFGLDIELSDDGSVLVVSAHRDGAPSVADIEDQSGVRYGAVHVYRKGLEGWEFDAYLKPSEIDPDDQFGISIALSGDGSRLVVGSPKEDSGIPSDPSDNSVSDSGAVYVYDYDGSNWSQTAFIKTDSLKSGVELGAAIDVSRDGTTILAGAPEDNSGNGAESDTSLFRSGAAYVFDFDGSSWSQAAFLKASSRSSSDYFGTYASLSEDGTVAVVGVPRADGPGDSSFNMGQAHVYREISGSWSEEAMLMASNAEASDEFGKSVAVSGDGKYIAISAPSENSLATGVNGDESNNDLFRVGAVYVFEENSNVWSQEAYIKPPANLTTNYSSSDFANDMAFNSDATRLILGHAANDSDYVGLANNPFDYGKPNSGSAYLYSRDNDLWALDFVIKSSNAEADDYFGVGVALSRDGSDIAVSASGEDSRYGGVGADQDNNDRPGSGAVYLY